MSEEKRQRCGTRTEPGPVSQFECGSCKRPCVTFRTRWFKGYHANGDEDREGFLCPDCGDTLDVVEITSDGNGL